MLGAAAGGREKQRFCRAANGLDSLGNSRDYGSDMGGASSYLSIECLSSLDLIVQLAGGCRVIRVV